MDCNASRFRGALLAAVLIAQITACTHKPVDVGFDPYKLAKDAKCETVTPKREHCAFAGDVFMAMTVVAIPTGGKKDKRNPRVMSAHCEVQILNHTQPTAIPEIRPCEDTTVTVSNPSILGEKSRSVLLSEKNKFVGGLPIGIYTVTASSEKYKTSVSVQEIPSGSQVKILLQMPMNFELPPPTQP